MKIVYLHGLESNNKGQKNDWLREHGSVYDPLIDYNEYRIYFKIREKINTLQPELIVGSSMGGYFAYWLANEFNIKAVLFNPALHSRSFEPDMYGLTKHQSKPEIYIVYGLKDDIIDPELTKAKFQDQPNTKFIEYSHGHRTPFDVFKTEIKKHIHS